VGNNLGGTFVCGKSRRGTKKIDSASHGYLKSARLPAILKLAHRCLVPVGKTSVSDEVAHLSELELLIVTEISTGSQSDCAKEDK